MRYGADERATLNEVHLRKLENRTMSNLLKGLNPARVLDAGCGNGYSTRIFASGLPASQFLGMDYSESMISVARGGCPPNCTFVLGDILQEETYPPGRFDCILTQRCLQNIPTYDQQKQAIRSMIHCLTPGGSLLLMECSREGVDQLNRLRVNICKRPLQHVEPWHNHFVTDQLLIDDFGAQVIFFSSTYMFLSKVIHHRLSGIAARLPSFGRFGYDRLYVISPT